jgi:hypothetical protein
VGETVVGPSGVIDVIGCEFGAAVSKPSWTEQAVKIRQKKNVMACFRAYSIVIGMFFSKSDV